MSHIERVAGIVLRSFRPGLGLLLALAWSGVVAGNAWAVPAAWTHETSLSQPYILPAAASLNGRVYMIGGAHSASSPGSRSVIAYNPGTGRWVARAALPDTRLGATAVAAAGHVYVIGGDGPAQSATNTLYMFHPKEDRWSIEPAALTASFDSPAVVAPNRAGHPAIYLFVGTSQVESSGGVSYATYRTKTYSYDTTTKRWSEKATSPGGMANGGAAGVINGVVYLNILTRTSPSSGGTCVNAPDDSSTGAYQSCVWTYSPATGAWRAVAAGAQPHGETQFGAVSADGKLVVLSEGPLSLSGPADDNAVEVYDPNQNAWLYAPDTLAAHDQGAIVTMGTRIYALGGRNPDTSATTRVAESINTTP
jgi:N-acetylneuraminic acid mutarotase